MEQSYLLLQLVQDMLLLLCESRALRRQRGLVPAKFYDHSPQHTQVPSQRLVLALQGLGLVLLLLQPGGQVSDEGAEEMEASLSLHLHQLLLTGSQRLHLVSQAAPTNLHAHSSRSANAQQKLQRPSSPVTSRWLIFSTSILKSSPVPDSRVCKQLIRSCVPKDSDCRGQPSFSSQGGI